VNDQLTAILYNIDLGLIDSGIYDEHRINIGKENCITE
jgi:hypothetical protein